VLQIVLALYILCFSLGLVVLVLSILSHQRTGKAPFKMFALLFTAALVFLLVDMLKIYERVFSGVFGESLKVIAAVFSASGNCLVAVFVPLVSFGIVATSISRLRFLVHLLVAVAITALGALGQMFPFSVFETLDALSIAGILVYGLVVLFRKFSEIEPAPLRSLVRDSLVLVPAMLALMLAQLFTRSLPAAPAIFREYPVTEVGFYLGIEILLLAYALKHLFKVEDGGRFALSESFIQRYKISPREREIVSMMAHGYNNQKIGESLFISTMTVKNHIYHIYQKTGVQNKIQLLNLINPAK
jgi:DNA-binding CsgD family transcriptional regulator